MWRGEAGILANLDDHVFLVWGLLELYETRLAARYLQAALELNQLMLDHFRDTENGGLFFTPDDGEELLVRQKEFYDGAIPSGNSVAFLNLLRLARLTGDQKLEERAAELGALFAGQAEGSPVAHTQFLSALAFALGPAHEVVIVGDPESRDTKEMLKALRAQFIPNKVVLLKSLGADETGIITLAPFVKSFAAIDGKSTAYVCSGFACQQPTTEIDELLRHLGVGGR